MLKTLQFAEYELCRYVAQMGVAVEISLAVDVSRFDETRFWRFDASLDDAFIVSVKDGEGSIVGTNSRAVLMAVYHFLKKQGCRFLRPGKDGEYVPQIAKVQDVEETWYAHMRHRGATDGGCGGGIDGMLTFIDWLPKMMMNSYFIEMTDFYSDMQIWYNYRENPYKKPDEISREQYDEWYGWLVEEIKKRGIIHHGAGHGWTNMLMEGITETKRGYVIKQTKDTTPCKNPEILAQINGKRELFDDTPLNTNLCFSQEKVRKEFARKVYEYSVAHPEIEYLHVWLGDAFSNFCECEECRKATPTDWYVKLLNDIDQELTDCGSSQKIVFLAYFELLYPPVCERIQNEERFTFLFCPFGRDFTKRYRDHEEQDYEPVPLNQYKRACMDMSLYLRQLRQWRKIFNGDYMVFDYNLCEPASIVDVTNQLQAEIVADDCLYMRQLGLNGRIECGNTRSMTPTSLIWHAMSEAFFYGRTYSEKAYYTDFFGEGEPVSEFLHSMRAVLPAEYMTYRRKWLTENEVGEIAKGLKRLREFRKVLFAYNPKDAFHRRNCRYFMEYLEVVERVLEIMMQKLAGISKEKLDELIEEYRHLVFRKEAAMPLYMPGRSWYSYMYMGLINGQ